MEVTDITYACISWNQTRTDRTLLYSLIFEKKLKELIYVFKHWEYNWQEILFYSLYLEYKWNNLYMYSNIKNGTQVSFQSI